MVIKISVIIPVYNMEQYLPECLNSVVSQTLKEIEIICINDGSTDKTMEILEKYNNRYTNLIVMEQNRQGAAVACNEALKIAKGEFIAILDSDDYYPDTQVLEKLYNAAVDNDVLVSGGSLKFDFEGRIKETSNPLRNLVFTKEGIMRYEEYQNCYGYTRFIYSRNMLIANNITFPLYMRNKDAIFMAKALSVSKRFATITDVTYIARYFDKKILFQNKMVILDIANGFLDLIRLANERNYQRLQELILKELQSWRDKFLVHIYKGNFELYDIFKEMDALVISEEMKQLEDYYINYDMQQIKYEVEEKIRYVQRIKQQINIYNHILIYGAGKIGKTIYDVMEGMGESKIIDFAVTETKVNTTARGKQIHCINEFIELKNDVLVIVAADSRINKEMEQYAKQLGFVNVLKVDREIIDIETYEISDGIFAFV